MKRKILLLVVLGVAAYFVFRIPDFASFPRPAHDYKEAMAKFAAIEKTEAGLPLGPEGKSRIFTHGHRTSRVFVLLHGLTNCPEQFVPLAHLLFQSGANVIIPRARYAGYADTMNALQGLQSGQDLIDQAATGLDIAAGLGDRISMVGLSGSAVAAAWMAENRGGIDSVLLLAPFFGLHGYPVWLIDSLAAILSKTPNSYRWWNDQLKEKNPGPPYAYPRYGTRSLADTIQLSRSVRSQINDGPFKAGTLNILTTGTDKGANNDLTVRVADDWKEANPGGVAIYNFPEKDGVPHDMVDPLQPEAKIQISYPKILEVLGVTGIPPEAISKEEHPRKR